MTLSVRAKKYLSGLSRIDDYLFSEQDTIAYCDKQNFPLTDTLLQIQVEYSGYHLMIRGNKRDSFLLSLFSRDDVKKNREIKFYRFDDIYVVDFGSHATAPFHFFITNLGAICTLGHEEGEQPNIICSSVEKCVERYALWDELALQKKDPHYYELINAPALISMLEQGFKLIEACSDAYAEWFTDGTFTVEKGTWLDRPAFYVTVYGPDEKNIEGFVNRLKENGVIPG